MFRTSEFLWDEEAHTCFKWLRLPVTDSSRWTTDWTALMQLINEVEKAQVLLDKCVYASAVPNVDSKTDASDGRRILGEEVGTGKLNHPPARPPFGCIVSPHIRSTPASVQQKRHLFLFYAFVLSVCVFISVILVCSVCRLTAIICRIFGRMINAPKKLSGSRRWATYLR